MAVTEGSNFPQGVKFQYVPYDKDNEAAGTCGFPVELNLDEDLKGKKVVIVAVPGAFTPTCSENHIPPFIKGAQQLKSKGVDHVIVLSANDPFVQEGWAKALGGYNDFFKFASDPLAKFTSGNDLTLDLTDKGLGVRTKRFALIVDDGKVTYKGVEPAGDVGVSGFDGVVAKL